MTIIIDCKGTKVELCQTKETGVLTALVVDGRPVDLTAGPVQHDDVDMIFADLRSLLKKLKLL